ncbi:MAG: YggT family protein [Desulfobacterales bacterium]|nr:YggT family protein [Desulfobacterales bacterium]
MGSLLYNFALILKFALNIYIYVIIASAILTWVNPDPFNPIVRFLKKITEPAYFYIRRYLPFLNIGGLDLAPIILILIVQFVQIFIVGSLIDLAYSIRF